MFCLFQGAGNLSYNQIKPDDADTLMPAVTDLFIKALETETQEKVLCHALEMFGLWAVNFRGEIPTKIVQTFKKGLDAKAQVLRTSYLQWFLACLLNGKLPSGSDFTAPLSKIVEKAA